MHGIRAAFPNVVSSDMESRVERSTRSDKAHRGFVYTAIGVSAAHVGIPELALI